MKSSRATRSDVLVLREALGALKPGAAHKANEAPDLADIFAPARHANALDPQRTLVVGNRGVGKSFWSSVLAHPEARDSVSLAFPRLKLTQICAVLGFHEAAGKDTGPAPSPDYLKQLSKEGFEPEQIWRGVLVQALRHELPGVIDLPTSIKDSIEWLNADLNRSEAAFRMADEAFLKKGKTFLLIFDALDRLGKDWEAITPLTKGILRLALDMRGYRAMKAKVFMRTDQSKDDSLFRFADASKIRSDEVKLTWKPVELFGLLYNQLTKDIPVREALFRLAGESKNSDITDDLRRDEILQEQLFYRLAGEFMGAGPKRGRTYTWIYDHLADTFGETSPRSFITAIQRAADQPPVPKDTAIDHSGIRAGVQDASKVRVRELNEDYEWIDKVMKALAGLEVPCDPAIFVSRWKDRNIIQQLRSDANDATSKLPLEVVSCVGPPELALLNALENIGVIEFRTETRINMPDIFRVEAGIKRRGGVRPPKTSKA